MSKTYSASASFRRTGTIGSQLLPPVGVECYAALALRARLSGSSAISQQTRRFARRSAIFSFALGMAGQVAYHLMKQAGITQAPWPVTTVVSCLPVLVLAIGTTLAHMLRDDAAAATAHPQSDGPASHQGSSSGDQEPGPGRGPDQACGSGPAVRADHSSCRRGTTGGRPVDAPNLASQARPEEAWAATAKLAAAGKPVSRRTLRAAGVRGSNEANSANSCSLPSPALAIPASRYLSRRA